MLLSWVILCERERELIQMFLSWVILRERERENYAQPNTIYVGNVFVLGSAGSEFESLVGAAMTGCKQCKASASKQSRQSLLTFSVTQSAIINKRLLFYSANHFAEQKLDG